MARKRLASALVACVLALVAGCGGGSSSSGTGGGGPTTVTLTFKGGAPTVVAARVGSGSFAAQALSSGTLSLSIPSGTTNFEVAYLCPPITYLSAGAQSQLTEQFVFEATTADGTSFSPTCPYTGFTGQTGTLFTGQTGTLMGSVDVSGISGAAFYEVQATNGTASTSTESSGPSGNFSFGAPSGNDRVEVVAYGTVMQSNVATLMLFGAKNFNGQAVPGALNGGSNVVLGAADSATQEPITYNNIPSGYSAPSTVVNFNLSGGGFLDALGSTSQYPALPAGAVEPGDFYSFVATSFNPGAQAVGATLSSSTGGPVTFNFPSPWAYAGPTPAALPTLNFAYSGFSGDSGVVDSALLGWSAGTNALNTFTVMATPNFLHGSTGVTFPDLSSVPGFFQTLASGTQVTWSAEVVQDSYGVLQTMPSSSTGAFVETDGIFTVP